MSQRFSKGAPRAAVAWCAFAALILGSLAEARASEIRATKDFADVDEVVKANVEKFGADHVLLALDIDNTVMAMDHDLGSDHWFEWQHYLLNNEPNSPHLVAKTFPELLKVQGLLYDRGTMHPTQPDLPAIIADLQKRGIATILLTSRGPEFRAVTDRELSRCGYDFSATALPVRDVPEGTYLAHDPANPDAGGLKAEEVAKYQLSEPRPVSYANGLFMTAGQHKGIMLLTLLKKSPREIKAIVYVDDNVRHIGAVFSAAVDRGLEITSIQYQHEEVRAQRFQFSDKREVGDRWKAIKGGTQVVTVAKPPQRQVVTKHIRCRPCRRCRR